MKQKNLLNILRNMFNKYEEKYQYYFTAYLDEKLTEICFL